MLAPLMGKPCEVLEIGSYEGRSARWLLDNVLTHPNAWLRCIDPFEDTRRWQLFEHNTRYYNNDQCSARKSKSVEYLPQLRQEGARFDFIYIDGSHEAPDVLFDAVLSFEMLRIGALMCFDDYAWNPGLDGTVHAPQLAIAAFCTVNKERLEILHAGVQVWLRRIA